MKGNPQANVRMIVVAVAVILSVAILLLVPARPVHAYDVQVSGLPDSITLDKETTIQVTIDLEGEAPFPIRKVEVILSRPAEGIIASGSFDENGTIIDDGGFIVSVGSIIGTIDQSLGFDNTTGNVYSVSILLQSSDFQASTGNEFTVVIYRDPTSAPLRSASTTFDITGVNPWPSVILGVAVIEAFILIVVFFASRRRRKVRKRRLRKE